MPSSCFHLFAEQLLGRQNASPYTRYLVSYINKNAIASGYISPRLV